MTGGEQAERELEPGLPGADDRDAPDGVAAAYAATSAR